MIQNRYDLKHSNTYVIKAKNKPNNTLSKQAYILI